MNRATRELWLQDDPFRRALSNDRLKQIVAERREAAKPELNFEQDLIAAAQNFNNEKIARLATVPQEAYLALFERKVGDDMRSVILAALSFRQIANATPDAREIVGKAENALRTLGARSKLNAFRLQKFGVSLLMDGNATDEEGAT
jgi:hypothetical protein